MRRFSLFPTIPCFFRFILLLCFASGFFGGRLAAQAVPRQSWEDIYKYPSRGLSPLYLPTGEEIKRILKEGDRWEVLPRPITGVVVSPDQAPCFEMHNGDGYYNHLWGNPEIIRWTAEQTWDGTFRLFFNTSVLARHGDEFLIRPFDTRELNVLSGHKWTAYASPKTGIFPRGPNTSSFARDAEEGWWVITSEGLNRWKAGKQVQVPIPNWPGGPVQGVVCDDRGRLAVWSNPSGKNANGIVGLYNKGKWTVVEVSRRRLHWTTAGIRVDGSVVMAGPSLLDIVENASNNSKQDDLNGEAVQRKLEHLRDGHFDLGDDRWISVVGAPVVTREGSALLIAQTVQGEKYGLVRIPPKGPPQWIDFSDTADEKPASRRMPPAWFHSTRIVSAGNGGFLLLTARQGLFLLSRDSSKPKNISNTVKNLSGGALLGCDPQGRIYFQYQKAFLVFTPKSIRDARKSTAEKILKSVLLTYPSQASRYRVVDARPISPFNQNTTSPPVRKEMVAAVDSAGNCWFTERSNGDLLVLRKDDREPRKFLDELSECRELWPGREKSLLAVQDEGQFTLIRDEKIAGSGDSLDTLGRKYFPQMRSAAPRSIGAGPRAFERPFSSEWFPAVGPWLCTGQCLWLSDGQAVYRLRAVENESELPENVEVKKIAAGDFAMLGPLQSGHLLLAKRDQKRHSSGMSIASWFSITDPEHKAELKIVALPPAEVNGGTLERPADITGSWLLDQRGTLWLHQGFDRVYHSQAPGRWPMLKDFGNPQFEFPAGYVWAYHGARVFPGYEVARDNFRRSCKPTYLEHLTPLFVRKEKNVCLTPIGLALLRFDPDKPDGDAVLQRVMVRWGKPPISFIGGTDHRAFFFSRSSGEPAELTAVDLDEAFP